MKRASLGRFRVTFPLAPVLLAACASTGPRAEVLDGSKADLADARECVFPEDGPVSDRPAELINVQDVQRALEAEFPRSRRDEGGTWISALLILVGRDGRPLEIEVNRSSGDPRVDEAALEVGRVMRFSAATRGDETVCVWISIPVTFRSRGSG